MVGTLYPLTLAILVKLFLAHGSDVAAPQPQGGPQKGSGDGDAYSRPEELIMNAAETQDGKTGGVCKKMAKQRVGNAL